ncbi:MAG TPA: sigma-70 family RNA polymerase sigma factor [Bacteroidales bacterium]|nr:sigma-70 family RNA polymerase sigma factor [Bacteroidales bacterium]HPR56813.1 sigma-70 family RNA polymerase sigma factor [Bacteroidales bacterium]
MTAKEFCNRTLPFKDKLYRLARRLLNNTEDAEDAVQEVFYKLWLKNDELDKLTSVEAFAMVVTKNLCLDRMKTTTHHKPDLNVLSSTGENPSPEKMIENKDEINAVRQIIEKLPLQQRLIIHLRDIEEMEYDEIEQITGMNPTAIRVNLSRARKTVRNKLLAKHNYAYQGD